MYKKLLMTVLLGIYILDPVSGFTATMGTWDVVLDYSHLTFSGIPFSVIGPPLTVSGSEASIASLDLRILDGIVDTSASASISGATAAARTTNDTLEASIQASGLSLSVLGQRVLADAVALRSISFSPLQSGNLTVSIPYSLSEQVLADPFLAFIASDVSATLELSRAVLGNPIPLRTLATQAFNNTVQGGEGINLSQSGVLTATVLFDTADEFGFLRLTVSDRIALQAVPEPFPWLVLASGLIALAMWRRVIAARH